MKAEESGVSLSVRISQTGFLHGMKWPKYTLGSLQMFDFHNAIGSWEYFLLHENNTEEKLNLED